MNLWKISTFGLAAMLGAVVSIGAASAHPQPSMENAIIHLKDARGNLERAAQDKGGHRVKAIQLTDEAIEEVKKGIEYANAHEGG